VALLAVVAREDLKGGALGFGIMNGCIGMGAVTPPCCCRVCGQRVSADAIVKIAALLFVTTLLVMAWVPLWLPLILVLILGGWPGPARRRV